MKITRILATSFAAILVFAFFSGLGTVCGSDNPIALIYAYDGDYVQSFKNLLQSNGIGVDLLTYDSLGSIDLSSYKLIIISNDTGFWGYDAGTLKSPVNSPHQKALAVAGSNRPVLGLGLGGSCYFSIFGLDIGWSKTWDGGAQKGIWVAQPNHKIFSSPNNLNSAFGDYFALYNSVDPEAVGSVYISYQIDGVTALGREQDYSHYALVEQKSGSDHYFIWGFRDSADRMTSTGKEVFINTVVYMGNIQTGNSSGGTFGFSLPSWALWVIAIAVVIVIICVVISSISKSRRTRSKFQDFRD
jgi:hypothetical protein